MKTILVPTEQTGAMEQALQCALLLAEKFAGRIEGFALRPAVAEMVAMDPDAGMTMVAVKENDADMVRQAEELFPPSCSGAALRSNRATLLPKVRSSPRPRLRRPPPP